jgi:hypothetical protein
MKYSQLLVVAAGLFCTRSCSAAGCLGHLEPVIPGTSITTAEDAVLSSSLHNISYCQVTGSVEYGHNNHSVKFELWLPSRDSYNGRFMVVGKKFPHPQIPWDNHLTREIIGNGGFAGVTDTDQMALQLKQGFAVAG